MRDVFSRGEKILVAHKNRILQDALVAALKKEDLEVMLPQDDRSLLETIDEKVDLSAVILDYRLIEDGGIASLIQIIKNRSDVPVIVFGETIPSWLVRPALKKGLMGVIPQDLGLNALPSLLDIVLAGVVYASPEWLSEPKQTNKINDLSTQEEAALRRASAGETNSQIACKMGLKETSVKRLMRSAGKKFGTTTRVQTCLAYAQLTNDLKSFSNGFHSTT